MSGAVVVVLAVVVVAGVVDGPVDPELEEGSIPPGP